MKKKPTTQAKLLAENEDLRARLGEAEETLRAIRSGEVDALFVSGVDGEQILTLKGADRAYRVLIENMNEGALTLAADGVILYANQRFAEMLKTPLKKVIGSVILTWIAPGRQEILQSLFRKNGDQKRREQFELTASDGTLMPVSLSVSNLPITETPVSLCLVATDMTEQKRRDAMVASEKMAYELLAATRQSEQKLEQRVIERTKQFEAANKELEEKTQRLQASEEKLKAHQEELQDTNEELEEKNKLLDRQKKEVELAGIAIEKKAEEVAVASRYKSEFLANMSHELRTPLNSLLLLAQGLSQNREGNLTPKQVEFSQIIHGSGTDLLNLINEILDLSRIEAGRLDLQLGTVRVSDLADSVQASFRHVAEEKGLDLDVVVDEDVPGEIVNDRKCIVQIVRNLVSNALKFTEKGKVTVTFSHLSWADGHWEDGKGKIVHLRMTGDGSPKTDDLFLSVAVSDTGIGIASELQKNIFKAFQQADSGTSRKYGGTGIGLTISRKLAHLLGGEILLESEPGNGATFTLCLPVTEPGGRKISAGDKSTVSRHDKKKQMILNLHETDVLFKDQKVLIVDDDMRTTFALSNILAAKGMHTLKADNGDRALRLLDQEPDVDLVLMDIMMPVMDGYETMGRIRAQERFRSLPIIVLTAKAMPEDRAKCITAGASDYLPKPLDEGRLISMVQVWLYKEMT